MLETLLPLARTGRAEASLLAALARAAAALARLDQALAGHPLAPALLHRARLEAVRRQAAVDGQSIDPWHLAALLEGLRLRMDPALRLADRGTIFAAARHALGLYQWLTAPDPDQERALRQADQALATAPGATPLLAAAHGLHAWLQAGGARPPMRAALTRFWVRHTLLRIPLPLTAAAALRPDTPWDRDAWIPACLTALADEAADALQLLMQLERAWLAARRAVADRRRQSRAAAAVDLLAAAPLVSASTLAAGLGMAVSNAAALLDGFHHAGLVVEVTHRARRRLFGLSGLAPLRDATAPPRRPEPGRGRGRPPSLPLADPVTEAPPPLPPVTPLERRAFDYADLAQAMAGLDQAIRRTRRTLDARAVAAPPAGALAREPEAAATPPDRDRDRAPDSGGVAND